MSRSRTRCAGARALVVSAAVAAAFAPSAAAEFPYRAGDPDDYTTYRLPAGAGQGPSDLQGKLTWMYAATPEPGNPWNSFPGELGGVRGASMVDQADVDTAWRTTTGRPDVAIAVLDSGIRWDDRNAMVDLRAKTRLTRAELPVPRHDRSQALEEGADCATYRAEHDANGDAVFNVIDYACDSRVERDPEARAARGQPSGVGPANLLDPQDVLIAFSDGDDDDGNGFVDDIVGWDFLDDDNDPFDDVAYGHGTGEARDSTAEANNGGELGACPNCMSIHMRVGDSFVADVNRFAQATIYAVDNGVLVVQEALGTLNNSRLARQAVDYAYEHGVTVIASAADEAAQHHNWPAMLPHVIQVNSVTQYDDLLSPIPRSYLQFNGCTNFNAKITVAIPSVSCSSDATGRGSGQAGLIYAAALNSIAAGRLDPHPTCRLTSGERCPLHPNEVRQLMASGAIGGTLQADDVDFASKPERSCAPVAREGCTNPEQNAPGNRLVVSPIVETRRYPARAGHDQFYGYGRVNMNRAVDALAPREGRALVPPEVEITSPDWFSQVDPGRRELEVGAQVWARGATYSCRVLVAPGSYPNTRETTDSPPGDFKVVPSDVCNGRPRAERIDGAVARLDIAELRSRFPSNANDFRGPEPGTTPQIANGRPNNDAYGFVVKVVATAGEGTLTRLGQDQRNLYLHRDRDLIDGFPLALTSDGAASPLVVDLDGDNRNELVVATSDGFVHAYRPGGSEARGWPVRGDRPPLHRGGRGFASGAISDDLGGAILASPAAADMDGDGRPEVVAADLEGRLYAWDWRGRRVLALEANPDWSGRPLRPFVDERLGHRNRTQHGFIGSPVLADLDRDDGGRLELIAAAMDRHVYAWNDDGSPVPGFPTLVVDRSKVASIDSESHQVRFRPNSEIGDDLNQGAIITTPAVGDIAGDERPEIVVGTNEEYEADRDGGLNAGNFNTTSISLLAQVPESPLSLANGRLYAIEPGGDPDGDLMAGDAPYVEGWPFRMPRILAELLPVVGEGVTGAPVIGPVSCPSGGRGAKVGAIPDAGPGVILNPNGTSCYGRDPTNGRDIALATDLAVSLQRYDLPSFPAVGHPAFGDFGGGMTMLAPVAGLKRALDLAINEYQGGQDFVGAWNAETGQFRVGFPSPVNDLSFLTGPSVADVDGRAGEEALAGTASLDLAALGADGRSFDAGAWPKLTSDWMVANPLIGSFGAIETDDDARKTVVAITRAGSVFAYATRARPCTPGSWPRFHHDNANSGDFRRDAVSPGAPTAVRVTGDRLVLRAPGDDLLCGRAERYEVVDSRGPISPRSFVRARRLRVEAPSPAEPGREQTIELPAGHRRSVAVRAVDEQGNAGRPAGPGVREELPPRLVVSVRPARAAVGRRVRLVVTVRIRAEGARRSARARGALVRLGGRRVRTNRRGRAVLQVRARRPGRLSGRATRRGARAARFTVRIARR